MGKKSRILVIDDEVDFLKIVKLNLEATGKYEVRTLVAAENIVAEVHDFEPDLILIDMLMPGVGGINACGLLNADSIGSNIPIIVISALSKESDKLSAYKKGILDYITKPVGINDLITKIEKALDLKEQEL